LHSSFIYVWKPHKTFPTPAPSKYFPDRAIFGTLLHSLEMEVLPHSRIWLTKNPEILRTKEFTVLYYKNLNLWSFTLPYPSAALCQLLPDRKKHFLGRDRHFILTSQKQGHISYLHILMYMLMLCIKS